MAELLHHFLLAWIPLFVALDPLGMVPVFLGLTAGAEPAERRAAANQATITAAAVCVGFMLLGKLVFGAIGITQADFQIAGGVILLALAVRDLVVAQDAQTRPCLDAAVVPLGLPLIAGPAAITALLILMDSSGWAMTLAALLVNLALLNLLLRLGERLAQWLGLKGLRAVSKIVALLLAAFAVSIIRRGLSEILAG
ncbi:hypothetical protein AAU61_02765 [Desulfocarbo indianensis]|nr:hypothetical protein AAU61_02765 [Desulfocarbo indianensis]